MPIRTELVTLAPGSVSTTLAVGDPERVPIRAGEFGMLAKGTDPTADGEFGIRFGNRHAQLLPTIGTDDLLLVYALH